MSVEYCDKGLFDKLSSVFENVKFNHSDFTKIDRLLDNDADLRLPMIVISRTGQTISPSPSMTEVKREGYYIPEMGGSFDAIPVDLTYQIDVMSDKRSEADSLWEDILFFLNLNSSVDVRYPGAEKYGNKGYSFILTIEDSDIATDIENFDDNGDFYRIVITIIVHDVRIIRFVKREQVESVSINIDMK